jgi:hypothetical protein
MSNFQSAAWSICDWWSWRTALHLVDPARSAVFEDVIIAASEMLTVRALVFTMTKRVTPNRVTNPIRNQRVTPN